MVSPSKKLQASAPFLIPVTDTNFQLVVVKPSGWETPQAPTLGERHPDTRTEPNNNELSSIDQQQPQGDTDHQMTNAASNTTDKSRTPKPISKAHHHNHPQHHPTTRSPMNGKPKSGNPGGDIGAGREGGNKGDNSSHHQTEQRGEKRRLDDEDHEDEEAEEVEKAMVDEDVAADGNGDHHNNDNGANGSGVRPSKKPKVDTPQSKVDTRAEDKTAAATTTTTSASTTKTPIRSSSRKAVVVLSSSSSNKKVSAAAKRKSRPITGDFVGEGRIVPVKDRPFTEPSCHRCGNMKNQPECILHSDETRCDKCIVDAQGCWWRRGPADYESIAGTTPQKKLIDYRDEADLKKMRESRDDKKKGANADGAAALSTGAGASGGPATRGASTSAAAAASGTTATPIGAAASAGRRKRGDDTKDTGKPGTTTEGGGQQTELEEDSRPLTRKSLRMAAASSKSIDVSSPAGAGGSGNDPKTPRTPGSALTKPSTVTSGTAAAAAKSRAAANQEKQKGKSNAKPTPASANKAKGGKFRLSAAMKAGNRGGRSVSESESESESGSGSGSGSGEEGSDEDEDEDEEDEDEDEEPRRNTASPRSRHRHPAAPSPKALKGKAARKEAPSYDQQLQRYERAEAKVRDDLWALAWERERLVKTEKKLQEELEEILAKKAQIRAEAKE